MGQFQPAAVMAGVILPFQTQILGLLESSSKPDAHTLQVAAAVHQTQLGSVHAVGALPKQLAAVTPQPQPVTEPAPLELDEAMHVPAV